MTEDFYTYDETEDREISETAQPQEDETQDSHFGVARIKVIGVGGAGGNAVNRLIESGLKAAEYYVINTDNQVLARSLAQNRIQIGVKLTKGLGAGADPSVGKLSAEENKDRIQQILKGTDLLFITAGMGGGTGTGASPVIAKLAREMKILTVAVVTLPFSFEGKKKMDYALAGVEELRKYVDSIIVIPNDKLRGVVKQGTSFPEALKVADEVLRQGIRGIAELIVNPSLINLDFADVRTTLKDRGVAHMGIGIAKGEKRIADAVRCAICSPLLNTTIEGASSVILNVVGGNDLTLDEVCQAAELVKGVIDYSANVIFGACIEENMTDEVEVVIIATGFPSGGQTITAANDMQTAAQRAAALSDKIDRARSRRRRKGTHPLRRCSRVSRLRPRPDSRAPITVRTCRQICRITCRTRKTVHGGRTPACRACRIYGTQITAMRSRIPRSRAITNRKCLSRRLATSLRPKRSTARNSWISS